MDKYLKKAKILTKYFQIYGYGNFDLNIENTAFIISLLCENDGNELELILKKLYERLEEQGMD